MQPVVQISSFEEYIEKIQEQKNLHIPTETPYKYEFLFRGQDDIRYELMPSIGRLDEKTHTRKLLDQERNLIEMAKYKMPDIFRSDLLPVELLALLQHHGIPTRLLDVTESALVALYFACGPTNKDGEVVVFRNTCCDVTTYPVVNAIADSYRFARGSRRLADFYDEVTKQPYFDEQKHMLEVSYKDDVSGGKWIKECCKKTFYIYAPIRSARQQAQRGRYILFPNTIDDSVYEEGFFSGRIDPMPKNHPDIIARIGIPSRLKKNLREDLKLYGISKESLFCDSIDKMCESIRESLSR